MSPKQRYWLAVALIVLTLGLLYPGLTQNALTIRGVLDIGASVPLPTNSAPRRSRPNVSHRCAVS